MKEEWLMPNAFVPVDVETTSELLAEIRRLIGVVGGMALNQRSDWQGLTEEEIWKHWWDRPEVPDGGDDSMEAEFVSAVRAIEAKLKEKNQ